MEIIESVAQFKKWRTQLEQNGCDIGFVPTMGALHEGHLRLIERCRAENEKVIVSIFVNPTQFNDKEDLRAYPVTVSADIEKIKDIADVLFLPTGDEMYPRGYNIQIVDNDESKILEGSFRPGHFDGMLTIVLKLLNVIRPSRCYFGEKDFQQLRLVQNMVEELFLDTQVVACPTVRESDGLAMSSRNQGLSVSERQLAPMLSRELSRALPLESIKRNLIDAGFEVEYLEEWKSRRLVAARLGKVRLIDNVETPVT